MLNDYLDWPGIGQVYRLEREFICPRSCSGLDKENRLLERS
jgi:hypothetical protein